MWTGQGQQYGTCPEILLQVTQATVQHTCTQDTYTLLFTGSTLEQLPSGQEAPGRGDGTLLPLIHPSNAVHCWVLCSVPNQKSSWNSKHRDNLTVLGGSHDLAAHLHSSWKFAIETRVRQSVTLVKCGCGVGLGCRSICFMSTAHTAKETTLRQTSTTKVRTVVQILVLLLTQNGTPPYFKIRRWDLNFQDSPYVPCF